MLYEKLILLFSLLASITISAQAAYRPTPTEFITETNVFEVPEKSASEIYNLSKVWMAENYEKPDRILVADTKDVLLKIKYFFEIPSKKKKYEN